MIKKINLALQGGGAHGAFTWGVLDRLLEEKNLQIEGISGTSAGAINAVVLAHGYILGGAAAARKCLQEFWHEISEFSSMFNPMQGSALNSFLAASSEHSPGYFWFDMMTRTFSPYEFNVFNFNLLEILLNKHISFEKICSSSPIKLFICATRVRNGKIRIFKTEELTSKVIQASTCLPFLFQSVEVDGEYYWDGGYVGNPAIYPLIYETENQDILIVHINPIVRDELPKKSNTILNRINEISFNASLLRELRAIAFVTQLKEKGWIKDEYQEQLKTVYMHSIQTDDILGHLSVASKFNTDKNFLNGLFKQGQEAGEQWLAQNMCHIGKKSTLNLDELTH